ncbi:hypothetical protein A3H89_00210 [Candidatus Amesbacteria bacterium RIFCSPLOWO2_02_FULL_48_11]|uniref:RHS repeat-associated core domain-containing protein n=2 Tax=Candidatus Amesiibacteriota TaxID=1752730 RepID=A0A1F4Z9M9_9BACT|nr:MAG: hypothetical protein A3C34_03505 [Candidatus Amesbacteria bacterium RIFCSPHIGHO2_02_FULL_48_21]OGC97635.1 MAG: hypothetical protein A2W16_01235 [Candidatus Amesbacteria bacterium RBG_16_48_31]OGD00002.1 MAG: hypothetical protein A2702_01690 [Candidatus Amesbacteria bacterium RIFCSPHIGHO2_01_FULL_48_75]OGD02235.1 MAG: hypothetical protein A2354_01000 [Candidatus Amesbacteria bacterium RIFOXYB1_FULL_47_12]OGD02895.1 MAG: hypothetical protein A3E17_01410 [Candidatus Amesbacteria bacterium 
MLPRRLFYFLLFTIYYLLFTPSASSAETLHFIHSDHLGSTGLTTDPAGKLVSKQVYYPFGSTRATSGTLPTRHQYTGQISDTDATGLYYYAARYYHPQTARFTQADKLGDGINKYSYANNNPPNFTDPSGMRSAKPPSQAEIEEKDISRIALAIFSETNNATAPENVMEILAWIFINRLLSPDLPLYTQGLGALLTSWQNNLDPYLKNQYIHPGMSTDELADTALDICYQNPDNCPRMSSQYKNAYSITQEVIQQYLSGHEDPTGGSLFFAHDAKLVRVSSTSGTVTKLHDLNQLIVWHQANLDYMKTKYPDFKGGITEIYDQIWTNKKSTPTFIIYGNYPCVWAGVCGYDRPDRNRPDKLKTSSLINTGNFTPF